jgi:peptidoglycan/xylan/chitin deacetylase (PgdA/CDA1 family)
MTSLARLARQAREAWEVPRDLLLRRYPPFVTGGELPRGHVPVFVFHSLEPEPFERKLRHLADNGYATLSSQQYLDVLAGRAPAPERAVVLTFDDGRGSLWSVGLPLLRRFGMNGIVFLVPGRTATRPGPAAPTLDDLEAGRAGAEDVLQREQRHEPFLTWQEIETLARSGVYEFHSHTLTHARIHVRGRLAGFLTPSLRRGYAAMDVPLIRSDGRDLLAHEAALGTPLFRSSPRTSEELRFVEEPEARRRCVEAVAAGGGEAFFARPGWQSELRRLVPADVPGTRETPSERERAIRAELTEARRLIEAHTGRPALHLCYPWHAAGPTARRLAREAGHVSAFCGKVKGTPITPPGGDPFAIARIGEDYVELLPGRGRLDLATVLRRKWRRRLRGAP